MTEQQPIAEKDALRERAAWLLAKYAGRSTWVGFEKPRREAWAEIESDLRDLLRATAPGAPMPDADYDAGQTPHTHGGTDAPECTQYGARCRPVAEDAGQCDHWNDRLPDGTVLRAIRCRRDAGHDGLHLCGDTSWSEDLGYRGAPCGGACPSCGSVAGYADGPPCLTCHYVLPPAEGHGAGR